MSDNNDILGDRRKALEESFFRKENDRLREELAAKKAEEADRATFADVCGITDQAALDALVEAGLTRETLAALSLVPLVEVAWADGNIDAKERDAILKAAGDRGLRPGGPTFQLLELWLDVRPESDLREAWTSYATTLAQSLSPDARAALKEDVIGRARDVASAAGGFLGIASVSKEEAEMLDTLAKAFD